MFLEYWESKLHREVSLAASDIYVCPRCFHRFSLLQSRGIACIGCREAVFGCNKLRCPRCDFEFEKSDEETKSLLRKISSIIEKDMKYFGERYG